MTTATDQREAIREALREFLVVPGAARPSSSPQRIPGQAAPATRPLADAARNLLATLGYESERRLPIVSTQQFCAQLDPGGKLTDREREALDRLSSLHLLFQVTDAELATHGDLFDDPESLQPTKIESYLFFAAELPSGHYARGDLSALVRAINKPLPMPALILFRHGENISLGIIHRRLSKRDQSRDVLEKVTLIKDIACADPIRAHLEILNDFVLANLDDDFGVPNFVRLHEAWQKRLGSYALSNDFYREIADWYFWAHHQVDNGAIRLPLHCDTEQEKSLFLIRLLTRLIFCWFLVEKRLLPAGLFRDRSLKELIKDLSPDASTYYHTVLQNLFFGTLNMPFEQRGFREKRKAGEKYDKNFGITNLWRHETDFRTPADWLALAARVPFLNGGLFDCLDDKTGKKQDNFILDGFSDNPKLACHLPNDLFFGPERAVDLSKDYGEETKRTARSKKAKVRGLIEILSRYKFTIEENTPLEEEIALDPELLGKVFENLLASYNEDTRTTARKALGAFYTPREIVSYMVDESLRSYLATQVPRCKGALEDLFSNKATLKEVRPDARNALIAAIGHIKILDPACGSGAFPMGALHRLVDLLQKLDPNNESWKRDRLAEARRYRQLLAESGAGKDEVAACDTRIADIEKSFDTRFHAIDYARKLYLIENCIYGVDIQPVAVQIAKLRFFISLVVDQKVDPQADNLGVRPLPNLETRLVAADTLIPVEKAESDLFSGEIDRLRAELAAIRHGHFNARSPDAKRQWRDADAAKRQEIGALLEREHAIPRDAARMLAAWDPYDQNASAPFFDSEWMFGLPVGKIHVGDKSPATLLGNFAFVNETPGQMEFPDPATKEFDSGFDVVIGNPPYVLIQAGMRNDPRLQRFRNIYEVASYKIDLYHLFIERGIKLLKNGGSLSYITPSNFATNNYCVTLRSFLLRVSQIRQFLTFDENVFQASVNNWVFLLSKGSSSGATKIGFYKGAINSGALTLDLIAILDQHAIQQGQGLLIPPSDSKAGAVLEALQTGRKTLGDIATVNFGMQLRDRKQFPSDVINGESEKKRITRHHRPCLTGRDIRRFAVIYGGLYCNFNYEAKRGGCWSESVHSASDKILVRQIGEFPEGGLDLKGYAVLNTAFMILPQQSENIPKVSRVLLAIINSQCVRFYWTNRFRDDRKAFPKIKGEYLKLLPIPEVGESQADLIAVVVNALITITFDFSVSSPASPTTRDPLMLAYWERILNGLVYELYFPDEVHAVGLRLFDLVAQAQLPDINAVPEASRLKTLRLKFEELYDGAHPLRIALDKLQTLDTVKIIEGKA
ncbi:MAG: TaqI-like C-terminal specificity domain-containing protein [Rhodospirillales bacterium]|jgi:type I restriction-modification system DNA methylase subunit|nr:TaqI-like C-terminal specificity domain-containing protein [Rhodospirillales bacterium]